MANQLASPGVSISVNDESIYVSSGAGTVPLIAIATASNKFGLDGSTIASGTTMSNTVNLLTSQRDLLIQYGKPSFKVVDGTPVHGYETNEYGLMTAYSYLGLSNRAYVVRADVDLSQLEPSATEPTSMPTAGTYWLDTVSTRVGLFISNSAGSSYGTWDPVNVLVTSDGDIVADMTYGYVPAPGFGNVGDYAWVSETTNNQIFYNDAGTWTAVDSSGTATTYNITGIAAGTGGAGYSQGATVMIDAPPMGGTQAEATATISAVIANGTGGSITGYTMNADGTGYLSTPMVTVVPAPTVTAVFSGTSGTNILTTTDTTGIYAGMVVTGSTGLGTGSSANTVIVGTVDSMTQITVLTPHDGAITGATLTFTDMGNGAVPGAVNTETVTGSYIVHVGPHYEIPTAIAAGEYWFKTTSPNHGFLPSLKKYIIANGQVEGTWQIPQTIINAYPDDSTANSNGQNVINRVYAQTMSGSASFMFRIYTSSGWQDLVYEAGDMEPTNPPMIGTLWYDDTVTVDLYRKSSLGWEPIQDANVYLGTDSPAMPSVGDIWVDTSDVENYPMIYEFDGEAWMMHDTSDQTTPNGCIFADLTTTAHDDSNGGAAALIDPEMGPNPLFYPTGMLCWNSVVSTGNVKMWNGTYWQTESGNVDAGVKAGQPYMLRKAQRQVVAKRLIAALELPALADEAISFTLIATPGYPEAISAMTNLNVERKQTAFVVGDSPLRLSPLGTSVSDWANGVGVGQDGEDGLTTHDTYSAIYYPSVLTKDLDGNNAVLPASYTVLRTYAYSDQVSYPWFAPAGLQRGIATNATNFGYINMEHEFVPVSLNNGQRDNLYINKVNPLVNFPGQGLFVFGQKTQHPYSSALDRVNVARLICYLRAQFEPLARPFLFEPNDKFTRTNVRMVFVDFLANMVSKRAIYDFLVVCDETNNTPSRIDANELYIDIAIAPEKAIEFIYIPIRVVNTGAIGNTVTAANLAAGA